MHALRILFSSLSLANSCVRQNVGLAWVAAFTGSSDCSLGTALPSHPPGGMTGEALSDLWAVVLTQVQHSHDKRSRIACASHFV